MGRRSVSIAVLLALGAVGVVLAVYVVRHGDSNDALPQPREFPPGTITAPLANEVDCGEYTWGTDAQVRETSTDTFELEHRCLLEALAAGTPAVLVEHSYTTEGDPIRQQIRVVAPNEYDLTYDATLDTFGSGTVDTVRCSELRIDHSAIQPHQCDLPQDDS
jgi:hypothetical protein